MKVGDLVRWKNRGTQFDYMIGVLLDIYTDGAGRERCNILWTCEREREDWIPLDILEAYNEV
tara:strand:+ start:2022 stop:2207 length:186 start_codon:yes stop_codon:yes gene_type:complete